MTPTPSPTPAAPGTVEPTKKQVEACIAWLVERGVPRQEQNERVRELAAFIATREAQARKEERERFEAAAIEWTPVNPSIQHACGTKWGRCRLCGSEIAPPDASPISRSVYDHHEYCALAEPAAARIRAGEP